MNTAVVRGEIRCAAILGEEVDGDTTMAQAHWEYDGIEYYVSMWNEDRADGQPERVLAGTWDFSGVEHEMIPEHLDFVALISDITNKDIDEVVIGHGLSLAKDEATRQRMASAIEAAGARLITTRELD